MAFVILGEGISSGVLQGSALDLFLFDSFINSLGNGMGNLLIKFAGDTELGGVGCSLEGIVRIQNDLEKLNGELDISKMKFSENKCKVLHLRERNHMYKYRIKNVCLGSNVAEKIFSIIMVHKLKSR